MRKSIAVALGVLVPLLGLAGVGSAQSTVPIEGVIQAVDCQGGTLDLATPDNVDTIAVAPFTAVFVESQTVSLCDLQPYVGSAATIWVVPNGNEFVATRIETTGQGMGAPVQQETVSPLPIVGAVLGTIVVGGLIYLIVRDGDQYYRYPYYGEYYHYYYNAGYRPYYGFWPATAAVILAAAAISGVVLGFTAIAGLDYLVVRGYDGHYMRYPYYGPYRARYYRPEYRAYAGPYRDAPVHYGDWRGGTARPAAAPYQGPAAGGQRFNYTPIPSRPNTYQRPNNNWQPQQYQRPGTYQAPQQYQRPNNNGRPQYQAPQRPQYQRGGSGSSGGGGRGRQCSSQQGGCQNR